MRAPYLTIAAAAAFMICAQAAHATLAISNDPTHNMNCAGGVCTSTAKKAVLNAGDLAAMLSGGNVKVKTGAGAVTIEVTAPLAWASTHRLTLDGLYNVSIKAPVAVEGSAGALTITDNDGGSGGDLLFFPGGKIDFWDLGSSLVINGASYTLVDSVPTLAADIAANSDGSYALANDYDAAADGVYKRAPVAADFGGVFEGLGHAVENLSIDATTDAGLFHSANFQATLRDVIVSDADVSSTDKYVSVGILVADNYGTIIGATATGRVEGTSTRTRGLGWVGGLAGLNSGVISRSASDVDATGSAFTGVGGLAGFNPKGATIVDSHAGGTISGGPHVWAGGIAGQSYSIVRCYARTRVTVGDRGQAGGLAGLGDGIDGSFAAGDITAGRQSIVGGLVGNGHDITNSYALGKAKAGVNSSVGGLAGGGGSIASAYSTGSVSGKNGALVGGFIGSDDVAGDISLAYWDLDTSGVNDTGRGAGNIANDPGIAGLSDAQLKSGLPAGFDPAVWGQNAAINNGYPYLLANPPQ